ncbi:MAG: hypothetical protein KatS3mg094_088 [Candidatus Parcubacteria bacterium]|nr:MAG: hypothetical protein KatS3mg094_088 [Candidatus Parcubacteria bacterium]
MKPLIFNAHHISLELLKKRLNPSEIIDNYEKQLEDYFLIKNPKYKFIKEYQQDFENFLKKKLKNKTLDKVGKWIYFPWNKKLIHCLDEKEFFETKTARNIYLLTKDEQIKFYKSRIGIAGLSVGSHIALTLAMIGGARYMKIADNDEISLSNLNRLRYPISSIGINKAIYCAQQIYEINPYASLKIYSEGITYKNIDNFLLKPKIDVLIEEMDNLYLKIKIREKAKKYRIPVIMATDHADNILIDIERYDLNPNYPILHGLLGNLSSENLKNLNPQDMIKITAKIAGANLATPRMLYSLIEVGKTIYSWPQLGNAATLCGVAVSYLSKKIILGGKIKEGRILLNIDKMLSILPKDFKKQQKYFLKKLKKL